MEEGAIGTDQDRNYVLAVGPDDRVTYKDVKLGGLVDSLRIVTDGLTAGDRLVVEGMQAVKPGMLVAPHFAGEQRQAALGAPSD